MKRRGGSRRRRPSRRWTRRRGRVGGGDIGGGRVQVKAAGWRRWQQIRRCRRLLRPSWCEGGGGGARLCGGARRWRVASPWGRDARTQGSWTSDHGENAGAGSSFLGGWASKCWENVAHGRIPCGPTAQGNGRDSPEDGPCRLQSSRLKPTQLLKKKTPPFMPKNMAKGQPTRRPRN